MAALCETTHSKRVIKRRHLTAHPKCRLRYTLCVASCLIILHTKPTPKDGFYNVAVVPICRNRRHDEALRHSKQPVSPHTSSREARQASSGYACRSVATSSLRQPVVCWNGLGSRSFARTGWGGGAQAMGWLGTSHAEPRTWCSSRMELSGFHPRASQVTASPRLRTALAPVIASPSQLAFHTNHLALIQTRSCLIRVPKVLSASGQQPSVEQPAFVGHHNFDRADAHLHVLQPTLTPLEEQAAPPRPYLSLISM